MLHPIPLRSFSACDTFQRLPPSCRRRGHRCKCTWSNPLPRLPRRPGGPPTRCRRRGRGPCPGPGRSGGGSRPRGRRSYRLPRRRSSRTGDIRRGQGSGRPEGASWRIRSREDKGGLREGNILKRRKTTRLQVLTSLLSRAVPLRAPLDSVRVAHAKVAILEATILVGGIARRT